MNENVNLIENDFLSSPFLIANVGAPFILGLAVGYFAKKMLRTALFIGGGIVVLFFIGEYYGIIHINDNQLVYATDVAIETAQKSSNFLIDRLTKFTAKGLSGSAGFFVGFKFG